jgi:hypothetical protein
MQGRGAGYNTVFHFLDKYKSVASKLRFLRNGLAIFINITLLSLFCANLNAIRYFYAFKMRIQKTTLYEEMDSIGYDFFYAITLGANCN